jgi:membrane-associated protease RseP (regulator of RpoE activity)
MFDAAPPLMLVPMLCALAVVHVLVLRGAARLLRLPVGRVFLRDGASRVRAALAALAGPLFQLLVAILFMAVAIAKVGTPADSVNLVVRVTPGKPAAGKLEEGDLLLAVDRQPITAAQPLTALVQRGQGAAVAIQLRRGDTTREESLTPVLEEGHYRIGVQLEPSMHPVSPAQAIPLATRRTLDRLGDLGRGFADRFAMREPGPLSGPVGMITRQHTASGPVWLALAWVFTLYTGFILLLFDAAWVFVRGAPVQPATRRG